MPIEKQNIVFTNRRSKETQDILDKILKTPAEIKINKNKEDETKDIPITKQETLKTDTETKKESTKKKNPIKEVKTDFEAVNLAEKYRNFGDKTPAFLLVKGELVKNEFK